MTGLRRTLLLLLLLLSAGRAGAEPIELPLDPLVLHIDRPPGWTVEQSVPPGTLIRLRGGPDIVARFTMVSVDEILNLDTWTRDLQQRLRVVSVPDADIRDVDMSAMEPVKIGRYDARQFTMSVRLRAGGDPSVTQVVAIGVASNLVLEAVVAAASPAVSKAQAATVEHLLDTLQVH